MSKTDNLIYALGLINGAIPSVARIIITLTNGDSINLKDLTQETEDIVEQKLKEAAEHLAK